MPKNHNTGTSAPFLNLAMNEYHWLKS